MALVGSYTTFLLMIKNIIPRFMTDKNLNKFLKKIEQLNQIAEIIKNNPQKKKLLKNCKDHDEVINLTSKWGFEIGKRWGED